MAEPTTGSDPYIQAQIAARQRPAVIKIGLLSLRSKYHKGWLFAVEGDDDKLTYSHWIARSHPDLAYEFFVCGGKRASRQLRNMLSADRGNAAAGVLFFVDRDFDDLTGFESVEQVFMLDKYSIENYLVDRSTLGEAIKLAYPGSGDPESRRKVCDLFESDYESFLGLTAELNKRIFISRRLRFDIDELIPDSLNSLAQVELGNVSASDVDAKQAIPLPKEVDDQSLAALEEEFAKLHPKDRYRGKFAMKFLRVWLDRLANEYRNPSRGLFSVPQQTNGKIKHDELSIGSLASRSKTPAGLAEFLFGAGC